MNQEARIKDFTDLYAWQQGHKLVLVVYKLTKRFPALELYGLSSQMRRAAVSVTSNLAEGFSRHSFSDKKHFYVMAQGSLTELQNQLIIVRDIALIAREEFDSVFSLSIMVHKLLTGLIKASGSRA